MSMHSGHSLKTGSSVPLPFGLFGHIFISSATQAYLFAYTLSAVNFYTLSAVNFSFPIPQPLAPSPYLLRIPFSLLALPMEGVYI